jgi:MFS family permease
MRSPADRALAAWRSLPASSRRVLAADFISNAGSGIVLPFLAVYVSRVRDHSAEAGAFTIALVAAGSLLANPVAGWAADRLGARPVALTGWVLAAGADLLLLSTGRLPGLFGAALLAGVGAGSSFPAVPTLLASVTPAEQRPLVYSARHGLLNIGFSGGIVISAIVVAEPDVAHFQLLFAMDSASFLIAGAMLVRRAASIPSAAVTTDRPPADHTSIDSVRDIRPAGYRALLADRTLLRFCVVELLIVAFGYAQFHAALPVFLSGSDGLRPGLIAVVFLTNTVVVAVLAVPAAAISTRMPRTHVICGGALSFTAAWTALTFSPGHTGPALSVACLAVTAMAVGEVLLAATMPALLNDLAPDHLRGRYNAADAITTSTGTIAGPLLVAALYVAGNSIVMPTLAVGCALAALLAIKTLHPTQLTPCTVSSNGGAS